MARQQRIDWFLLTQRPRRKSVRKRQQTKNGRRATFEALENRNLLSVSTGLAEANSVSVANYAVPSDGEHEHHAAGDHDHRHELTTADWLGDFYEPLAAAEDGDSHDPDVLTVILDFIDPGQANGVDGFGNVVSTFDVTSFGFALEDYEMVTEAVLLQVQSHYYDIATDDVFPQSAIPEGMELNLHFEIGDQGVPPVNGSSDYYYMQIGRFISGSCAGAAGCAGINFMRSPEGTPEVPAGSVVGSVFSDVVQGIGGIDPPGLLSSGNLEFTAGALGLVTSHEAGHSLSLNHLAVEGSVTPNGFVPIMATPAIDSDPQEQFTNAEFSFSGNNPQMGDQEQFHINQLVNAIGLTEAGSGPRGSAITVDSLVDEFDGDTTEGNLSLREAIDRATEQGQRRKIRFAEELAGGTIALDATLGSIMVPGPVVIEGLQGNDRISIQAPAANPALTELGDGQVFVIQYGEQAEFSTTPVSLSDLRLTGAESTSDGGAVFTEHGLILAEVALDNNFSSGRGGAIYSTAMLELMASQLTSNQADGDGGAVHSSGGVLVEQSTLAGNESGGEGGAISAVGNGTEVIVTSSTISGNTATGNGGGLRVEDENPTKFRILHSTVFQNTSGGSGGGVYHLDGVLALEHSIVAGNNDAGSAPDIDNLNFVASPTVLARFSLIGDSTGNFITQLDPNLFDVDPQLGPLQDNGGATLTHEPADTSPALNGGNPNIPVPPEFDQRGLGFRRILEGVVDIGAVESGGFSETFTVDSIVDKDDITSTGEDTSPEDTTLREAISLANIQLGPNLINFSPSLSGQTLALRADLGELEVTDSLTIDADALPRSLSISASDLDLTPLVNDGSGGRILRLDDGDNSNFIDIELIGLTLSGGDVAGDGGAIHSVENLVLREVSLLDNYASGNGGGVYHNNLNEPSGRLLIENSTLARNEAGNDGGGLYSNTQKIIPIPNPEVDPPLVIGQVVNTTVSNNTAGNEGGGVFNFEGRLELSHVTITENQASNGSGVVSYGDPFTTTVVYSSIIAGNEINRNNPADPTDDTGFDVQSSLIAPTNSFESLGYNLIGVGNTFLAFNNNDLTGIEDPRLRPLADNGGKTMTHLPFSNSSVVDAGDPAAVLPGEIIDETSVTVTQYDQRGMPFSRVVDGNVDEVERIDIGAVELPTPEPSGDFDSDGDTDGSDFLAWQRGFGKTNALPGDGDSNEDGKVDITDLQNWSNLYGTSGPVLIVASVEASESVLTPDIKSSLRDSSATVSVEATVDDTSGYSFAAVRETNHGKQSRAAEDFAPGRRSEFQLADVAFDTLDATESEARGASTKSSAGLQVSRGSQQVRDTIELVDEVFGRIGLGKEFDQREV